MTSIFVAVAITDRFGNEKIIAAYPTKADAERACAQYERIHGAWYTYVNEVTFINNREEDV